jgi:hypothetical protein
MTSKEFIRAKLVSRTNADCSDVKAKNNRRHYFLRFEQSIGWDWLYGQISKASNDTDTNLELWEIHPSGMNDFEVEVREVERRAEIDDSQHGLTDFERKT